VLRPFRAPGDSSSTLMAIGLLAGNVSFSASSSRSFLRAIAAERDFCGFLSTSWSADYPILGEKTGRAGFSELRKVKI